MAEKTKSKFIVFLKPGLVIFLGGIFLCLLFNSGSDFKTDKAEAAVLTCNDKGQSCWIDSATVSGNTLYVSGGAKLGYSVTGNCPAGSYALCTTKAYRYRAVDGRIDSGSWSSASFNVTSDGRNQTCSLEGKEGYISFSFSRDISGLSTRNYTVTVRVLNDAGQQTTCSKTF